MHGFAFEAANDLVCVSPCSASITAHTAPVPMVLEIPSKDVAYEPAKDPIMKRVLQMLGEAP